jgi:hypothetical protein
MTEFEKELQVGDKARSGLLTSSKWAKFLSIVGLVGCGCVIFGTLTVLVGYAMLPTALFMEKQARSGLAMSVSMGVLYAIYIIPLIMQLRFASRARWAVETGDQRQLVESLYWQKRYVVFMGSMVIVALSLAILTVLTMIIAIAAK